MENEAEDFLKRICQAAIKDEMQTEEGRRVCFNDNAELLRGLALFAYKQGDKIVAIEKWQQDSDKLYPEQAKLFGQIAERIAELEEWISELVGFDILNPPDLEMGTKAAPERSCTTCNSGYTFARNTTDMNCSILKHDVCGSKEKGYSDWTPKPSTGELPTDCCSCTLDSDSKRIGAVGLLTNLGLHILAPVLYDKWTNECKELEGALYLACERIADGPQSYEEANTKEGWAHHFLTKVNGKEPKQEAKLRPKEVHCTCYEKDDPACPRHGEREGKELKNLTAVEELIANKASKQDSDHIVDANKKVEGEAWLRIYRHGVWDIITLPIGVRARMNDKINLIELENVSPSDLRTNGEFISKERLAVLTDQIEADELIMESMAKEKGAAMEIIQNLIKPCARNSFVITKWTKKAENYLKRTE